MRFLALLIALAAPVYAADPVHITHARKFVQAFDRKDAGTMAIIAAQTSRKVPYALVLFSLLETREFEAARKLASLRAGAPEGKGLVLLCEGYISGVRAGDDELARSKMAETFLRARKAAEALATLGKVRGTEGTITGARLEWTRARALIQREKWEPAVEVLARCASLARAIGWIQLSAAAEARRLKISRERSTMVAIANDAATNLIADARALDDPRAELNARVSRAAMRLRAGRTKDARSDYSVAIQRARALGNPEQVGKLLSSLAQVFHLIEGQPRRAIRLYREALDVFETTNSVANVVQARINLARALSDSGDYDGAEQMLNDALKQQDGLPAELVRAARVHLAYVYRRQGRLDHGRVIYAQLLKNAATKEEKQALHLDLGELELLRGDFYLAREHFRAAGSRQPVRALAGEAAAFGGLHDEARCADLFGKALAAATTPVARGRVELQWAAFERNFGQIDRAIQLVESARTKLATKDSKDLGNAATSWVLLADLLLLDSRRASALEALEGASVLFYRLKDSARALPAYAREVLVLLRDSGKGDVDSAVQRLTPMQDMAESVKSKSLRSVERCTHAMVSASIGDPEGAQGLLDEAVVLARDAGDWQRQATALSIRAFLRGADGLDDALRALQLADEQIDWSPVVHPRVVGERPDDAASIALRCFMESEKREFHLALDLVGRVKAQRILLALRGRDAILAHRLNSTEFRSYVDARSALREARATRAEVDVMTAATSRLRDVIAKLAPKAPIAFPVRPTLEQIRTVLREGELLCLFVDDPFARALLVIDESTSEVRTFDPAKPWDAIADLLKGKKRVIVAADGFLALAPRDGVELRYVTSAAGLVNQRTRPVRSDRVQLQRPSQPVPIDLQHPQATDAWSASDGAAKLVLLDGVVVTAGPSASIDGYAAAAAARLQGGADWVLISLSGKTDPRVVATFRKHFEEEKFDLMTALRRTRKWAARQDGLEVSTLVLWGAP